MPIYPWKLLLDDDASSTVTPRRRSKHGPTTTTILPSWRALPLCSSRVHDHPWEQQQQALAPEVSNVSSATPPLMIAQNEDDPAAHVENSLMLYYKACRIYVPSHHAQPPN